MTEFADRLREAIAHRRFAFAKQEVASLNFDAIALTAMELGGQDDPSELYQEMRQISGEALRSNDLEQISAVCLPLPNLVKVAFGFSDIATALRSRELTGKFIPEIKMTEAQDWDQLVQQDKNQFFLDAMQRLQTVREAKIRVENGANLRGEKNNLSAISEKEIEQATRLVIGKLHRDLPMPIGCAHELFPEMADILSAKPPVAPDRFWTDVFMANVRLNTGKTGQMLQSLTPECQQEFASGQDGVASFYHCEDNLDAAEAIYQAVLGSILTAEENVKLQQGFLSALKKYSDGEDFIGDEEVGLEEEDLFEFYRFKFILSHGSAAMIEQEINAHKERGDLAQFLLDDLGVEGFRNAVLLNKPQIAQMILNAAEDEQIKKTLIESSFEEINAAFETEADLRQMLLIMMEAVQGAARDQVITSASCRNSVGEMLLSNRMASVAILVDHLSTLDLRKNFVQEVDGALTPWGEFWGQHGSSQSWVEFRDGVLQSNEPPSTSVNSPTRGSTRGNTNDGR